MATQQKKAKPFQIVMIIIFAALIAIALMVFSGADRQQSDDPTKINYGPVTVWGPFRQKGMSVLMKEFSDEYRTTVAPNYVYVPPDAFDQKLLEALASDKAPDVVILPAEWLSRNKDRIAPFPYDPLKGGVNARDYKDTFVQSGEIFMYPQGIMALPITMDPLVLYWNRDLFTNAGIASPPKEWKDLLGMTPKLTKKNNLDIEKSAIALGEYVNIPTAKDILTLMFLQLGNSITEITPSGTFQPTLKRGGNGIAQAVRFYSDFVNPLKSTYTWNRSFKNAQETFLAGDLAMYIDYSSEYPGIIEKNPRLNVDLAGVPQTSGQPVEITTGRVYGLAVIKKAKNVQGGYVFSKLFAGKKYAEKFSVLTETAPMRRDLLAVPQSDAYRALYNDSALKSRGWVDPNPTKTREIFARLIDAVTSGRANIDAAISQADLELLTLIQGN